MAEAIYIPSNSIQGFSFLHILDNICYASLFDDGHSDRCEVILMVVLIYISLMISDVEHLPIC